MRYSREKSDSSSRARALGLRHPDAEQLTRVVPLVERLGGVDPLEALEPDERRAQHARQRLRGLRLADAGLPLEQQRLRKPDRAEQRRREALLREVVVLGELGDQGVRVGDLLGEAHGDQAPSVRGRVGQEGVLAAGAAEVVALTVDVGMDGRLDGRDGHLADRVDRRGARGRLVDEKRQGAEAQRGIPLLDDLGEDRQGDLLRRPRTDVQPGRRVHALLERVVDIEGVEHRPTPLGARDQADVGDARIERVDERLLLVEPVRGDDDGVGRAHLRQRPGLDLVAEGGAHHGQRLRDRTVTDDADRRGGQHRLHEDLQGPAGQAGVVHDGLAGLLRLRLRRDPQQDGGSGLERREPLRSHRRLRALAADEPLDRAVGEDDRLVPRLGRRRALREHHAGVHERDPVGAKRLGPLVHCPRGHVDQCPSTRRPCLHARCCPGWRARRWPG